MAEGPNQEKRGKNMKKILQSRRLCLLLSLTKLIKSELQLFLRPNVRKMSITF